MGSANGYEVQEIRSLEKLHDVVELYDRCTSQKTGATIRDREYWHRHFDWVTKPPNYLVIIYRDGEMTGFGRYSVVNEAAVIKEMGCVEEPSRFLEMFVQIVRHIRSDGARTISVGYFTPDHPLVSLSGDDVGIEIHDNPTLRMRLINIKALFSNMLPCLVKRLRANSVTQYENCITVRCEVGGAALNIRQDDIHVLDAESGTTDLFMQQIDLIRLVLGQTVVQDVEFEGIEKLSERDIEMLDILFPKERSLYWQSDHF
jgi:predicted acetyltransferase